MTTATQRLLLVPLFAALLLVTCSKTNSQGWTQEEIEREVRICQNALRDKLPTFEDAVNSNIGSLMMAETNKVMIETGCDCTVKTVAQTYPFSRWNDDSYRYETKSALAAAKKDCLNKYAKTHPGTGPFY